MLAEAAAPALLPLSPLPQEPIPSPRPLEAFSFFPTSPACAVAGSFGFFHVLLVWLGGLLPWRAHWAHFSPRTCLCSPETHARRAG